MNPEPSGATRAEATVHISPLGFDVPPPWPDLPADPPRRRRSRAVAIAIVATVLMTIAAGVVAMRDPRPGATAPPEPIAIPTLTGLLLSPTEAAEVVGSQTMSGNPDMGDTIYRAMSDKTVADAECMSLSPGLELAYQGTGFTASRQQFLQGSSADRKVVQTVVSFPDAEMAGKHLAATRHAWQACADRIVNLGSPGGQPELWAVGTVSQSDGIVTTSRLQDGGDGWMCRDGIVARNNVVIDVAVCGEDVAGSVPTDFVARVDDKISALR